MLNEKENANSNVSIDLWANTNGDSSGHCGVCTFRDLPKVGEKKKDTIYSQARAWTGSLMIIAK